MANTPNLITRSMSLADLLGTAVSDGTYEDVIDTAKVDRELKEVPASLAYRHGGQLWSNLADDAIKRTVQGYYKSVKLWSVADATERDALGSDDDLEAGDLLFQQDSTEFYKCASVDGEALSTWAALSSSAAVTIDLPATGGAPTDVGDGAPVYGLSGSGVPQLELPASESRGIAWAVHVPDGYAGGSLTLQLTWSGSAASTNVVRWVVQAKRILADVDLTDETETPPVTKVFLAPGPESAGHVVVHSESITNGDLDGAEAGDLLSLALFRSGASMDDTYTGTAGLLGARLIQA